MLEQRIQQHFLDCADLHYQAAQALAKPADDAVAALLACVTNGGKVMACGNGTAGAAARQFAGYCVGRFERDRPGLAAIALAAAPAGTPTPNDRRHGFARDVRALGQMGDVLLAISPDGNCGNVREAVAAAHEREMSVLALTGAGGGALAGVLRETDVHLCVPHARAARVHEVQLLLLHVLADGVDTQLLGEEEPNA